MLRYWNLPLFIGVGILFGACGPEELGDEGVQSSLFLSNQSLTVSVVPVRVAVDGEEVFSEMVPSVGPSGGIPQHYWIRHNIVLSRGSHSVEVFAEVFSGAELSATVEVLNPMYLVLNFQSGSETSGTFTLSISDSEPAFQ